MPGPTTREHALSRSNKRQMIVFELQINKSFAGTIVSIFHENDKADWLVYKRQPFLLD